MSRTYLKRGQISSVDFSAGSPILSFLVPSKLRKTGYGAWRYVAVYLIVVFASYGVPLILAARLNALFLTSGSPLRMGYLRDINVFVMTVVCLPVLIVLQIKETLLIPEVIDDIVDNRIIWFDSETTSDPTGQFVEQARRGIKLANIVGQLFGIVVAFIVIYINRNAQSTLHGLSFQTVGAEPGNLNTVGWFYLFGQLGLFYFVLSHSVIRMITTTAFFYRLTNTFEFDINPLSAPSIGGLGPVSRIGILYQLGVAVFGINVGSTIYVMWILGDGVPHSITLVAVAVYLCIAPIAFMGPLVPFRRKIMEAKNKHLSAIGERVRVDSEFLYSAIKFGDSLQGLHKNLRRSMEVYSSVQKFPEWPLEYRTIQKFGVVLVSSPVSALIVWLIDSLLSTIGTVV
jgi:hypothetical protein